MPIYFGVFVHRMQIWSLSVQILPKFCPRSSDFQKMENPTPSPQIVMRRGKAKAEVTLWDLDYNYVKGTRFDNHMNVSLNILELYTDPLLLDYFHFFTIISIQDLLCTFIPHHQVKNFLFLMAWRAGTDEKNMRMIIMLKSKINEGPNLVRCDPLQIKYIKEGS